MPTDTESKPEIRSSDTLIPALKNYIIYHGRRQRLAKIARRSRRTPDATRQRLLLELGLQDDLPKIQAFVALQSHWLTVAHVLYGDLRGRPHPVADPEPLRKLRSFFLSHVLTSD